MRIYYSVKQSMRKNATYNYQRARARLIEKGTDVANWARLKGFPLMTVYDALKGKRNGPKAVKVRQKLEEFLK